MANGAIKVLMACQVDKVIDRARGLHGVKNRGVLTHIGDHRCCVSFAWIDAQCECVGELLSLSRGTLKRGALGCPIGKCTRGRCVDWC